MHDHSDKLAGITAKKGDDGSVTIQFGDCDGAFPIYLPIDDGWTHMLRPYRPDAAILDGLWKVSCSGSRELTRLRPFWARCGHHARRCGRGCAGRNASDALRRLE